MSRDKKTKKKSLTVLIIIGGAIILGGFLFYLFHSEEKQIVDFAKKEVQALLTDPTSAKFWGIKVIQRPDNLLAVCGKVNRSIDGKSLYFLRFVSYDSGKDSIWFTQVEGYDSRAEMNELYKKYCIDIGNNNTVVYEE